MLSFLSRLIDGGTSRSTTNQTSRSPNRARLCLERMEDRSLMSANPIASVTGTPSLPRLAGPVAAQVAVAPPLSLEIVPLASSASGQAAGTKNGVSANQVVKFSLAQDQLIYGFRSTGNDHHNWFFKNGYGFRNEKWFKDRGNTWYYIIPNGSIYKWLGGGDGRLVTMAGQATWSNPNRLFNALTSLRKALHRPQQYFGFHTYARNYDQNWLARNGHIARGEKWFKDRANARHFITQDGSIYKYLGGGSYRMVMRTDPAVWNNPMILLSA